MADLDLDLDLHRGSRTGIPSSGVVVANTTLLSHVGASHSVDGVIGAALPGVSTVHLGGNGGDGRSGGLTVDRLGNGVNINVSALTGLMDPTATTATAAAKGNADTRTTTTAASSTTSTTLTGDNSNNKQTADAINAVWNGAGLSGAMARSGLNGMASGVNVNGLSFDEDARWSGTVWAADGRDVDAAWKPITGGAVIGGGGSGGGVSGGVGGGIGLPGRSVTMHDLNMNMNMDMDMDMNMNMNATALMTTPPPPAPLPSGAGMSVSEAGGGSAHMDSSKHKRNDNININNNINNNHEDDNNNN